MKVLKPTSFAYQHIRSMFSYLSEAKLKVGIFVRLQIKKIMASKELEEAMPDVEKNV